MKTGLWCLTFGSCCECMGRSSLCCLHPLAHLKQKQKKSMWMYCVAACDVVFKSLFNLSFFLCKWINITLTLYLIWSKMTNTFVGFSIWVLLTFKQTCKETKREYREFCTVEIWKSGRWDISQFEPSLQKRSRQRPWRKQGLILFFCLGYEGRQY